MATNYTGNVTPSLSNAPASSWTDDAAKRSHVGNTYLVTGSGGTAGNVYAFEEYAAPLVKQASGLPADIVTITDGGEDLPMVKAEVTLSPIQSLNGYDHPWAAGAGKNKLAPWITSQTLNDIIWTANADGSAKASGTANGSSQPFSPNIVLPNGSYIISGCPSGGGSSTYFIRVLAYNSGGTLVDNWSDYGSGASFTIDSTIDHIRVFASVNNGVTAPSGTWYPMIRLASVTDSTFAPYENLCPISGHTGATLNVTGKNLGEISADNISQVQRATFAYQNGGVVVTATNTYARANYHFKVKIGQKYTISFKGKTDSAIFGRVYFGNTTGFNSEYGYLTLSTTETGYTKTITATAEDFYFSPYVTNGNQTSGVMTIKDFQVELGSSASAYVPYNPSSAQYTSSFGQTVYGGTFDFVSGKLVVEWANADLSDHSWTYVERLGVFWTILPVTPKDRFDAICSCYPYNGEYSDLSDKQCGYVYFNRFCVKDSSYNGDSVAFKAAMSGVQLTYELATPIEIDLDPTEVETLLGLNNVWASDGQISALTYQSNQFIPKYDWFETWNMPKITRNNGSVIVLPYPKEYTPEIHDVDAATTGRNAAGTMIRDRVAIKHKFNYVFPPLSQADATELLAATKDASFTLTTASPETGAKTNYRVYAGDKSLPVYWMPNHDTASWLYSSVSVNLIEM